MTGFEGAFRNMTEIWGFKKMAAFNKSFFWPFSKIQGKKGHLFSATAISQIKNGIHKQDGRIAIPHYPHVSQTAISMTRYFPTCKSQAACYKLFFSR